MEVAGSNSVLEPEQNGELSYFSKIQERQNTSAVQEYMSVKIFKNTIKQTTGSNNASATEHQSFKSKSGENSKSVKQDENEESKNEEQKIE